jgi:hypothetical protein
MSNETHDFDRGATEARYDALKAVPVAPMARVEMTDKWREVGGPGSPAELLTRGLCMACHNSGFLHKDIGGRLYVVQDAQTNKLVRCFCERGHGVDR